MIITCMQQHTKSIVSNAPISYNNLLLLYNVIIQCYFAEQGNYLFTLSRVTNYGYKGFINRFTEEAWETELARFQYIMYSCMLRLFKGHDMLSNNSSSYTSQPVDTRVIDTKYPR